MVFRTIMHGPSVTEVTRSLTYTTPSLSADQKFFSLRWWGGSGFCFLIFFSAIKRSFQLWFFFKARWLAHPWGSCSQSLPSTCCKIDWQRISDLIVRDKFLYNSQEQSIELLIFIRKLILLLQGNQGKSILFRSEKSQCWPNATTIPIPFD